MESERKGDSRVEMKKKNRKLQTVGKSKVERETIYLEQRVGRRRERLNGGIIDKGKGAWVGNG